MRELLQEWFAKNRLSLVGSWYRRDGGSIFMEKGSRSGFN